MDELERLRRRFSDLEERHKQTLQRLREDAESESSFYRLGWFALQRSWSGFALFADTLRLANPRWHQLARPDEWARWLLSDRHGERSYSDLGTLVRQEVGRVPVGDAVTLFLTRSDGERELRLRLERVATRTGEVALVIADDMTGEREREDELKKLRERVLQRERLNALGRLAAGIVHDLGNDLNALSLRLHAAGRTVGDADHCKKHMAGMLEGVDDMRSILERLDRFAGRRSVPLVPVALGAVIDEALALVAPELRKVRIERRLPNKLPRVQAHAGDLKSVFVNLFINARDAMPGGGTLRVAARADADVVVVTVADTGCGFSAEHLPRVFEPFFTTKGERGHGLGLALAYGIVDGCGGTLRAGNGPDGGAVLTLELPRSVLRRPRRVVGDGRARLR